MKSHPSRPIWAGARGLLAVGLLATVGTRWLNDPHPGGPIGIRADTPLTELIRLVAAEAQSDVAYADTAPPSRDVATLMAGVGSRGGRATLIVPGTMPALSVTPPVHPVALRRSALGVTLRAEPGADVSVVVDGGAGAADTVSVRIGPSGVAAVSIAVEPTRAGPAVWTVEAGGAPVTTHAWVRPEAPVRVLVWTGTPGWESRYLVRALEAAGAHVSVHQALGQEQVVGSEGATRPRAMADLDGWDVVTLVGPVASVPSALLRRWVAERGGGLLLVGPPETGPTETGPTARVLALARWAPSSLAIPRPTDAIRWGGPAEIVPLPAADLAARITVVPGGGLSIATLPVAWGDDPEASTSEIYASANWVGRGRIFSTGIESWPWVMEGGFEEGHRRYWESIVEWLAGGLTVDLALEGDVGVPGVAWTGRLVGQAPPSIDIRRPSTAPTTAGVTTTENRTEFLVPFSLEGESRQVRFVPERTGGHTIGTGPGGPSFGVVVVDGSDRAAWTEAALRVGGGGGVVRTVRDGETSLYPRPLPQPGRGRWLVFLALGSLTVVAWTMRRVAGLV